MAIEWSVRINRTFTLRDLVIGSRAALREILGHGDDANLEVLARSELLAGGVCVAIEDRRLTEPIDPKLSRAGAESADFELTSELIHGRCVFGLAEFLPRSDDPESGLFAYISSDRTPGSYVLSIAVSIAAADCSASTIVDDGAYLRSGRIVNSGELRSMLRVHGSNPPLDIAIEAILAKTRLGGEASL